MNNRLSVVKGERGVIIAAVSAPLEKWMSVVDAFLKKQHRPKKITPTGMEQWLSKVSGDIPFGKDGWPMFNIGSGGLDPHDAAVNGFFDLAGYILPIPSPRYFLQVVDENEIGERVVWQINWVPKYIPETAGDRWGEEGFLIFLFPDLHGSDHCYQKFLQKTE